jgi:hypothetical protein
MDINPIRAALANVLMFMDLSRIAFSPKEQRGSGHLRCSIVDEMTIADGDHLSLSETLVFLLGKNRERAPGRDCVLDKIFRKISQGFPQASKAP